MQLRSLLQTFDLDPLGTESNLEALIFDSETANKLIGKVNKILQKSYSVTTLLQSRIQLWNLDLKRTDFDLTIWGGEYYEH